MSHTPTASRRRDANNGPANPTMDRVAATQQETIDRIADEANGVRRGEPSPATLLNVAYFEDCTSAWKGSPRGMSESRRSNSVFTTA